MEPLVVASTLNLCGSTLIIRVVKHAIVSCRVKPQFKIVVCLGRIWYTWNLDDIASVDAEIKMTLQQHESEPNIDAIKLSRFGHTTRHTIAAGTLCMDRIMTFHIARFEHTSSRTRMGGQRDGTELGMGLL